MAANPETTEVAKAQTAPPSCRVGQAGLEVESLDSMWWLSNRIYTSNLCPTDCKRPEDVFIRVQMGYEIGLKPMQSVQNIATINGRPALWGPLVKGLVLSSGECEEWEEEWIGKDDGSFADDFGHRVTVKRKGFKNPFVVTFTVRDAKKAGLWGKNVWSSYPKDMIVGKTRARAAKGMFGDILGGLAPADDASDPVLTEAEVLGTEINRPPRNLDDVAAQMTTSNQSEDTAARIRREEAERLKAEAAMERCDEQDLVDPETGEIEEPEPANASAVPNLF